MITTVIIDGPSVRGVWKNVMRKKPSPQSPHPLAPSPKMGHQPVRRCASRNDTARLVRASERGESTFGGMSPSQELYLSMHAGKWPAAFTSAKDFPLMMLLLFRGCASTPMKKSQILLIGHDHIHAITGLALRNENRRPRWWFSRRNGS